MLFPEIGKAAPDFSLKNQNGEEISLASQRGKKVIFYFYPKASTPGCTTQACGLTSAKKELEDLNTVVYGVSPDPQIKLKKFIEKKELNFDLLSDEDHAIADKYGCWGLKKFMGKEYMGILRTTFLINEEGVLVHIMDKVKTKTHHDEMIQVIKSL